MCYKQLRKDFYFSDGLQKMQTNLSTKNRKKTEYNIKERGLSICGHCRAPKATGFEGQDPGRMAGVEKP